MACRVSDTARGSQFRCRRAGRRGQRAGRWGQWAGRRGQLPGLMRFKGGRLQNGRWLSPRVCGTRRSPKRLLPALRPQGELQSPPASPGDSLRSTGGSDPDNFHGTASDLGPEPVRFCVHPARVESISCNLLALPKVSTFKTKRSGGWPSWCRLGMGSSMWGADLSLL